MILLKQQPGLRAKLGAEGRRSLYLKCWDRIFVELYKAYEMCKVSRAQLPATDGSRRLVPQLTGH